MDHAEIEKSITIDFKRKFFSILLRYFKFTLIGPSNSSFFAIFKDKKTFEMIPITESASNVFFL